MYVVLVLEIKLSAYLSLPHIDYVDEDVLGPYDLQECKDMIQELAVTSRRSNVATTIE